MTDEARTQPMTELSQHDQDGLMLLQARYSLRNLHVIHPDCGYAKLADACQRAADDRASLKARIQVLESALTSALGEIRDLSRPTASVYDRSTKTYSFSDETIRAVLPGTFETIQTINTALNPQEKAND